MKRDVLSSPRLKELKKKRRDAILYKLIILILGFAVLAGLGAYLSRLPGLNISEIAVSGNNVVETGLIRAVVEEKISGKYLWLFPRSNILFYPKKSIARELQKRFHRLDNIEVSARDRKTLNISVSERVAKYMWCGGDFLPDVQRLGGEKCYFMDESGYVFDQAPFFSGEVYFKFYGPGDLDPEDPAGRYFSEQNFKQLVQFKDTLTSMKLEPVIMNIKENEDVEVYLARGGKNALGPKIIFKSDADLKNVAENLQAALGAEPLMSGFKNKYSILEYIDLRFGNKVYFKFEE